MMERKLYKTKLCILYQRGRCARQSCTFAHGEAELRRFGGSLNGRRDYRSGDLRDKLDRRYSPRRRYSPGREGRGRHGFQSNKFAPHDRGHSISRSPVARRGGRNKKQIDGQSVSGSQDEDQLKEGKASPDEDTDALEEQLKHAQLDIELLDDQRHQLEIHFEEKAQEVDKLSAKVEDLGMQLNKEQEDCKRFASKIKKFTKAYRRYLRAQEDLRRSQVRLQRLGDQLGTDYSRPGNNEEDSSVNAISDGGPNGDGFLSPRHEVHIHTSPIKKKLRLQSGSNEEIKPGNSRKRERFMGMSTRQEKLSQIEALIPLSENKSKETEMANMSLTKNDVFKHLGDERKQKHGRNSSPVAKVKGSDSGHLLPSTCMAAHAVDEFIELMDIEKSGTGDATVAFENGTVETRSSLPFRTPLPPKVAQDTYLQYEGDDEDVDVDGVDVDIGGPNGSSEVEIEQV